MRRESAPVLSTTVSDASPKRDVHGLREEIAESFMAEYVEAVVELSIRCLRPGGSLLTKVLHGDELMPLLERLKPLFTAGGALVKPPASRKTSREMYLLCRGFEPGGADSWKRSRRRSSWWW